MPYYIFKAGHIAKVTNRRKSLMKNEKIASKSKLILRCGSVAVGDIFAASYGYEQTNVSFYQVVALKGKKTVIVKRIKGKFTASHSSMSGEKKPVVDDFFKNEPAVVLRVSDRYHDVPVIKIDSYTTAFLTHKDEVHEYSSWY